MIDRKTRNFVSDKKIIESDQNLFCRMSFFIDKLCAEDFSCCLVISHYNLLRAMMQIIEGKNELDLQHPHRCSYGSFSVISAISTEVKFWSIDQIFSDTHLSNELLAE